MVSMLANHLWQSTLFAIGIAALTQLMRNNGAHIRYWLWLAASMKFLIPFSLLTMLGAWLGRDAIPVNVVGDWSAVERFAEPMADSPSPTVLALSLLAVWACGFVAVLGFWAVRAVRIRTMLRTAVPGPAASPHAFEAAGRLPVKYSTVPMEPALVGILRPVLLLPQGIDEHLTQRQLRAVVAHELSHWRRRDNLTAALHMVVEAVFWFHPLVWWIGARLVDEREHACDEVVVGSGHDREAYAEGILNVCQFYVASSLACASGVSGADLKERITDIMRRQAMNELHVVKKLLLGAGALCVLAVPVAVGLLTAGGTALAQQNQEFLPVVKVAPRYPEHAAERGLEGYVIVEYTVTQNGSVTDAYVVESTSSLFEEAALESTLKYKYEPRIENGQPVAVPGVRTKITFVLNRQL